MYIRLLLIRGLLGRLTPEEKQALDAILEANPEARSQNADLDSLSPEDLQIMAGLLDNTDLNAGLEAVHLEKYEADQRRKRSVKRYIFIAAAAAAVISAVVFLLPRQQARQQQGNIAATEGGSATLVLDDGTVISLKDTGMQQHHSTGASFVNNNRVLALDENAAPSEGWTTLVVPARLDYQVKLGDGSTVWLNSRSRLRFRFNLRRNREVFLEAGEAYFKVSADARNPFTVHTPQGEVQVLGTEFNVNAYTQHKTVTSLVTGKVAIRSGVDHIELQPGNEALVNAGESIKVEPFDANRTLSWRKGIHYFENATITSIAEMLDRWFNTPLIIDNPGVGKERLWGRLDRNQSLQQFIDVINLTGDVTFYWKNDELHVK